MKKHNTKYSFFDEEIYIIHLLAKGGRDATQIFEVIKLRYKAYVAIAKYINALAKKPEYVVHQFSKKEIDVTINSALIAASRGKTA